MPSTAYATGPGYRISGNAGGPPIVLGPSLGTSTAVWDEHVDILGAERRVLRYDLPGHGSLAAGSAAETEPAGAVADPEGMARLAHGVLALADRFGLETFDYAGISIGGAIGLYLGRYHPDRLRSLIIVCSSANFGPPTGWLERAAAVRAHGTGSLTDTLRGRWFTPAFAQRNPDRVDALLADVAETDDAGYARCCEALAAYDLRGELAKVEVPTLVIAGRDDPVSPPTHARLLADGVPGAALQEIPAASHLAAVEQPGAVAAAMGAFLGAHSPAPGVARTGAPDGGARHSAGMAVRRAVLGDPHVDAAVAGTTPFTADFQDLITRYAWGEIWTRPGLDRRARSIVTLTALVAGGHHNELAMHVRGAVRNGLTHEEIAEVLLQSAIYCGVPAANTAFAIARDTLQAMQDAGE